MSNQLLYVSFQSYPSTVGVIDLVTKNYTHVAGCDTNGIAVAEVKGKDACFGFPAGIALSTSGNTLFLAEYFGSVIRRIDLKTDNYTTTILAGDQDVNGNIALGSGTSAKLPFPSFMTLRVNPSGPGDELIVSMLKSAAIMRVSTGRGDVSYFTSPHSDPVDALGLDARFSSISGMAFDAANNLIVADAGANKIRIISPSGLVKTLAGTGKTLPYTSQTVAASSATFNQPSGIAVDKMTGYIYISDTENRRICVLDPVALTVGTFAGTGDDDHIDGDSLTEAAFRNPGQLAVFDDIVYVLDSLHRDYRQYYFHSSYTQSEIGDRFAFIRKGEVNTIALDTADDNALPFNFNGIASGITTDSAGNVFFSDYWNKRIVKWSPGPGSKAYIYFRRDTGGPDTRMWPAGLVIDPTTSPPTMIVANPLGWFGNWVQSASIGEGASNLYGISMGAVPAELKTPMFKGIGSLDGILTNFDDDGGAALTPFYLALDSNRTVFTSHGFHSKIMRLGVLMGQPCNFTVPAHSPAHVCRPGTFVNWGLKTCEPCPSTSSLDVFPFSSYCIDSSGASVIGESSSPNLQTLRSSNSASSTAGLTTAMAVIAAFLTLSAAVVLAVVRRLRIEKLRRRPGQAEAVSALVSSINMARRDSFRGLSPLAAAASLRAAVMTGADPAAARFAGGSSGGADSAAAAPAASSNVTALAFADLLPDASTLPLFGGFGVVFSARWVSRGIRVAVKIPKDLIVSGYLPPAAAAELVKEAQGLVRASDNLANEFVVRLFGVAQGDGGAAWAAASERARALHFARKSGSSDSAADCDPHAAATATPAPTGGFQLLGLVMAFEEGGTLAELLQPPPQLLRPAWPSTMVDRLRIARELTLGLWHLHRLGIVHGDLKLENVLLSGGVERHVRLADFGLSDLRNMADAAANFAQSRVSTAIVADKKRGTWPYMVRNYLCATFALTTLALLTSPHLTVLAHPINDRRRRCLRDPPRIRSRSRPRAARTSTRWARCCGVFACGSAPCARARACARALLHPLSSARSAHYLPSHVLYLLRLLFLALQGGHDGPRAVARGALPVRPGGGAAR